MSQSTTVYAIAAHTNGVPLIGKTKEFKPPTVEKVTESVGGGRAIEGTRTKGWKMNPWSFQQEGMTAEIANQMGLAQGDTYSLTFKESVEDSDGNVVAYVHTITGEVTKRGKDGSKAGDEDVWSLDGFADTYKLTINGAVVDDINIKAQKVIIGGVDQMADHLSNVR